jgi:anti-anti-sigma factor
MTLSLAAQEIQDVHVIELAGHLTFYDKSLSEVIQRLLSEGSRHFVLRMRKLSFMDAEGLGQLVRVYNLVQRAGGSLTLSEPNPRIRTLLQITKLDTVFPMTEGER